jgi:dipeptidyl aminopeptidase/acylaminoacyl peptidase
MIDLASQKRTELLRHTTWRLWNPRFSPDNRWLAFNATTADRSRLFVAPVRTDPPVAESEWIPIANGIWDDKPRWSPDGNTLYFVSERDHFRCIWAHRLNSRKYFVGEPLPIYHAHQARNSISGTQLGRFELSVARDKIVFNMTERTGNIWLTRLSNRR